MADDAGPATNSGAHQCPHESTMQASVPTSQTHEQGVQQTKPTVAGPSDAGAYSQTLASNRTESTRRDRVRPTKRELRDPKKFTEEVILWRIDQLLLRAKPVYQHGQIDGTSLWSPNDGQGNIEGGFSMFDGFDLLWYVPTRFLSPFPEFLRDKVKEDLLARKGAIDGAQESQQGADFTNKVSSLIEEEARTNCQDEWDTGRNKDQSTMTWGEAKSKSQFTILQMVTMIAKKRLLDGRALLPDYYRANIVELSCCGKLFTKSWGIPGHADLNGICARLDTWSPIDSPISQRTLKVAQGKLNIARQHGTEIGQDKAAAVQKELDKPGYSPLHEGGSWYFKLQVKEKYTLPRGKGPGRPKPKDGWVPLKEESSLQVLKEGISGGKHAVFARLWKIQLRRLWPQLEELKDHILPNDGEPQLTNDQLQVLDNLLAEQTTEEREQGRQLASVLSFLEEPTYRLEFAGQEA